MKNLIDTTLDRILISGFEPQTAQFVHKVPVMLVIVQGVIDHGGFAYLFEIPFKLEVDLYDFVEVYFAIGAISCANAIRDAIQRRALMAHSYHDLDLIVQTASAENFQLLENYIKNHKQYYW